MASLPLSSLPSGSLHLDAFQGLDYSLGRAHDVNEFILTTIRRNGEHEVEDILHLWVSSRGNGGSYVSASCAGTQCCPNAPQGDLRYLLFSNGDWLKVNGERALISQLDEPCNGVQETEILNDGDRALAKRPGEETSSMTAKVLSGLTKILLNKSDYSTTAIKTAWKGNPKASSLLELWHKAAVNKLNPISAFTVTKQRTTKTRKEADYLHWLSKIMFGFLVFSQTRGNLLPGNHPTENRFIEWTRRLPKLLRLLQVADMTGLLVLTVFGNSFFTFTELGRTSESHLADFVKSEWANLKPKLSYLYYRLRGTVAFKQELYIFNPVAFCCYYLGVLNGKTVDYQEMCEQFGASDWVKAKSDIFERKTIGELLAPQEDPHLNLSLYTASSKDSKEWTELMAAVDGFQVDSNTAAERQPTQSPQSIISCTHSYTSPHAASILGDPGAGVESDRLHENNSVSSPAARPSISGTTRSGWEMNETVSSRPVQGLEALADAATCAPHHDADSGYGGSACSQVSVVPLLNPQLPPQQDRMSPPRRAWVLGSQIAHGAHAVGETSHINMMPSISENTVAGYIGQSDQEPLAASGNVSLETATRSVSEPPSSSDYNITSISGLPATHLGERVSSLGKRRRVSYDISSNSAANGNTYTTNFPLNPEPSSLQPDSMSISYLLRDSDADSSDTQMTLRGREPPTAITIYNAAVRSTFHDYADKLCLPSQTTQPPRVGLNNVNAPDLNTLYPQGSDLQSQAPLFQERLDMDDMQDWAEVRSGMSVGNIMGMHVDDDLSWNTVGTPSDEQLEEWNKEFAEMYGL